jgi:hypothetical protein
MYRIFNVAIDSELPLPELPEFDPPAGSAVYRFDVVADGVDAASRGGIEWFHDWVDLHGNVTIRAGRSGSKSWLRFPRLADFEIDRVGRRITIHALQGVDSASIRHLLLDQVIPRVLGQEGNLVLHAGAVQLPSGKTVAFVGDTGYGKSTLVSSFERNGARLITDDCLLVTLDGAVACAVPNYAGVRLFDDSIRAVYGADRGVTDVAQYTSKRRVVLADAAAVPMKAGASLDALFLLGDPTNAGADISLSPASGSDALMTLVGQTFLLDNTDKALMATLFLASGSLLRDAVSSYMLNYPRVHDRLGELREAIEREVG